MREADLEQLYARLERPLCNVLYRWLWSMDEAQDVAQEAFVRLWRMRDRVRLETVEPPVYRIAVNLARSRRRRRSLWRWVSLEAVRDRASTVRPADETLASRERGAEVRAAVEALPDDLRSVVLLTELSELSYAEIGEILSIPAGTVGSRRHRALRRLRAALGSAE